jgi:hypothetical protein
VIAQILPAGRALYLSGMAIRAACAIAFPFAFSTKGTAGALLIHAIAGAFAGWSERASPARSDGPG